jgi:large subunit ribosomal protein L9
MDVILLEKIKGLGDLGELVKVKPGYGRNYLIPQGKALPATRENIAEFEKRRAELERTQADKFAAARARAAQLAEVTVVIARKTAGEGKLFGSVNAADIADSVTEATGIELNRQEIRLADGPLRQIGEYKVAVHLYSEVSSEIKVHIVREE